MKKNIHLIFLLLFSASSMAQHPVEKIFLDGGDFSAVKIVSNDSSILSVGRIGAKFYIGKFDNSFTPHWTKGYSDNSTNYFSTSDCLGLTDGGVLVTGIIVDSLSLLPTSIIFKTDSLGGLVFSHQLVDSLIPSRTIEAYRLLPCTDSTFYLFSNIDNGESVGVSLINLNGEVLHSRFFRDLQHSSLISFQSAFLRGNANCVLFATSYDGTTSQIMLMELDSTLDLISNKNYYIIGDGLQCKDAAENPLDHSIIVAAYLSNSVYRNPLFFKIDASNDILWSKFVSCTLPSSSVQTVVQIGNRYYFTGDNPSTYYNTPYLLVTDTSGSILNSETFHHVGQFTDFSKVIDMHDSLMIPFCGRQGYDDGPGFMIIDSLLHSSCSADDFSFSEAAFSLLTNQSIFTNTLILNSVDVTSGYVVADYTNSIFDDCSLVSVNDFEKQVDELQCSIINNLLMIRLNDFGIFGEIRIYNMAGNKVYECAVNSESVSFDLSGLSSGVYIINARGRLSSISKRLVWINEFK